MLPLLRTLPALLLLVASTAAAAEPAPPGEQVVVLRNGRVLRGAIAREPGEYVVTFAPGSQLRLKLEEVDFCCPTLDDAYLARRARNRFGDVPRHVEMAEWCLAQGLVSRAAEELLIVMERDPRHPRITTLERRLQAAFKAANPRPTAPAAVAQASFEAPALPAEKSLLALPPGSVDYFTRHVQPLLMNKCAAHGCHGTGTSSSYVLLRPLQGAPPQRFTHQNLRATLAHVDDAAPDKSLLLRAAAAPHGGAASAMLGTHDARQYEMLVAWVRYVSSQGADDVSDTPSPADTPAARTAASGGPPGVTPAETYRDLLHQRQLEMGLLRGPAGPPELSDDDLTPTPKAGAASDGAKNPAAAAPVGASAAPPPANSPRPAFQPRDPFDPAAFNDRFTPPEK